MPIADMLEGPGGDLRGRTLGDFVVEEKLGAGGFGTVYRARQPLLDREAVIKVLHTNLRATSVITERFLREARLASRLDHPYAAHIYAFGAEADGMLWLAMELVRGTTLTEYLRANGRLPLDRFVPLLERICEVIHTAHEAGIVHRDIKPANVMVVSRAGRLLPKLLDFGIAKAILDDRPPAPRPRPSRPSMPPDALLRRRDEIADTLQAVDTPVDTLDTMMPMTSLTGSSIADDEPPVRDSELTMQGSLIGSPHYMAPEQWHDAASVDRRTDLYALGILAYEALTGARPFSGNAIEELALAHERGAIAPVPPPLPRALDDVFARALAHDPANRFANALDMAAAFRAAAGLAEAKPLPQLDEPIRERLVAEAPQPIAEAIAALEAARTPRQARDALWSCTGTLARYLAILALASRSRMTSESDGPHAVEALRRAGTGLLTDDDSLAIAAALVRSHVDRPDLHPIPELVLFFGGTGLARYRELAAMRTDLGDANADDEVMRQRLARALAVASSLLREALFVCDYPLVVPRAARPGAQRWTGTRRMQRVTIPVTTAVTESSHAILVDAHGEPVIDLHPLLQIEPPTPGAEPDVFLYAGRGDRGSKLVAPPFEIHDDAVSEWLRLQMATTFDHDERRASEEQAPYRGLDTFTAEDSQFFFGRERLVDTVVNRLRVQSLVAIVGRSGSGKSSFVQAGVVPALGSSWISLLVRPGGAPMSALARGLAALGIVETRADAEHLSPRELADLVDDAGPTLLLVDQFEEIFTLTSDERERHQFAAVIAELASRPDGRARVVVTLRDDFLVRAEALPGLRDRFAQGLQLLGVPDRDDLVRILVEPARRAGYQFEDATLVERMVAEVEAQPGALALLSFTASRMWEHRDRHFRRLTRRAYEALGGVGGALAQHAETLLAAMPRDEQRLVREAFRHLVTSDGTRAVLARSELTAILGGNTGVIERLVGSRLLVASEGETEEQIEIAHEALLAAWPRLVTWRREDAEGARMRDQIREAAKQWDARNRPQGLLWRGDVLAEYNAWRRRHPGELGPVETAFTTASLADAARSRSLRRAFLVGSFALLAIGLVVLFQMQRTADRERLRASANADVAQHRLVDLRIEQGRLALLARDSMRALAYFSSAYSSGANGLDLHFMIARAAADLDRQQHVLEHGHGEVLEVAFVNAGRSVVSVGEAGAKVWDAASGALRFELPHTARVWSVDVDDREREHGARILTASRDKTVKIWSADTGALVRTFDHPAPVRIARFSPDGKRMASSCADKLIRLWDAESGKLLATLAGHDEHARDLTFDPSGTRLLTASIDRTARIWSLVPLASEITAHTKLEHGNWVWAAKFSPDGTRVATASMDRTVRIWEATTGREIRTLKHFHRVGGLAFRPDGKQLVTGSDDHRATLWNVETGDPVVTLMGHTNYVTAATFSPDGKRLLTYSADHTARLWDVQTGAEIDRFIGHSQTISAGVFDPRGERIATTSDDGTVRMWDAKARQMISALGLADGDSPPFARANDLVLVDNTRGRPALYDARDGSLVRRLELGIAETARWNPEGTFIAVATATAVKLFDAKGTAVATIAVAGADRVWLSRDGEHLVIAFAQRDSELWSRTGRLAVLPDTRGTNDVQFGNGLQFASGHENGTLKVWSGSTLQRSITAHSRYISRVIWSDDRQQIATTSPDKTARLWNANDGRSIAILQGHTDYVGSIELHPSDRLAVTASDDATAKVWNTRTGSLLYSYAIFGSVGWASFSPDGAHLWIVRSDTTEDQAPMLQLWSANLDKRSPEALADFVRCRVPLRFQGELLVPASRERCR